MISATRNTYQCGLLSEDDSSKDKVMHHYRSTEVPLTYLSYLFFMK